MKVDLYNLQNKKVGTTDVPDEMFNAPWRPALVHQVVVSQKANRRRPWAHAKDRSEVSGGGRKPWRQKGTGRARHGSIRSPIWRGGGKAHGPTKERTYEKKINKKMQQAAIASVLSRKLRDEEVRVFDNLVFPEAKTKQADQVLRSLVEIPPRAKKFDVLLVPYEADRKSMHQAARNLMKTKVSSSNALSLDDLLTHKHIFFDARAISNTKTVNHSAGGGSSSGGKL